MSKYEITHSCGCTETVEVFGTNVHGERDRKLAKLSSQPCAACRAKAANSIEGMAALEGSDKQVAWAADIRKDMLDMIDREVAKMPAEQQAQAQEIGGKAKANLASLASAKWFIEHRSDSDAKILYAAINREF